MMSLSIQIQSLSLSFLFGMFFSLLFNLAYKYLFSFKLGYRILSNVLFVLSLSTLYFLLLKIVNNGILHIYFFIILFLGFIFGNVKCKSLRTIE